MHNGPEEASRGGLTASGHGSDEGSLGGAAKIEEGLRQQAEVQKQIQGWQH